MIVESNNSGNDEIIKKYFGEEDNRLADLQYNMDLVMGTQSLVENPFSNINSTICNWVKNMPEWSWSSWVVSKISKSTNKMAIHYLKLGDG